MFKIEDEGHLIALNKVLNYVKFKCEEYECRYLAGSPIIGELYKQVSESLAPYYKRVGIDLPTKWEDIEKFPHYLVIIEKHIEHTDNWNDLTLETKKEFINCLIFPYESNDKTVHYMIEHGNKYHANK